MRPPLSWDSQQLMPKLLHNLLFPPGNLHLCHSEPLGGLALGLFPKIPHQNNGAVPLLQQVERLAQGDQVAGQLLGDSTGVQLPAPVLLALGQRNGRRTDPQRFDNRFLADFQQLCQLRDGRLPPMVVAKPFPRAGDLERELLDGAADLDRPPSRKRRRISPRITGTA